MVRQYDIYWVELNPTVGVEMAKIRPCVVVSPDSLNNHLRSVIIAPITSIIKNVSFRTQCILGGRRGEIAADQIRSIDKSRLKGKIAALQSNEIVALQSIFRQMFCE